MKDITNKRFGRLVALCTAGKTKHGGYVWLCQCDCGKKHKTTSAILISGGAKSCGCLEREANKLIDRVGQKFGKLTIIRKAEGNRKKWVVKCDCGVEKTVLYGNLTGGSTKSCGCWLKQRSEWYVAGNKKAEGESAKTAILNTYKRGAKERNLVWDLTEDDFVKITKSNCYYCGIEPHRKGRTATRNGHYIYNGIDRVNNTKGYELENCVPCCKTCNRAKDTMTKNEFLDWIKRVFINSIFNSNTSLTKKVQEYENNNQTKIQRSEKN